MKPFVDSLYWFKETMLVVNQVKRYFTVTLDDDPDEPTTIPLYIIVTKKGEKWYGLPKGDKDLIKSCLSHQKYWSMLVDKQATCPVKFNTKWTGHFDFKPEQKKAIAIVSKGERGILVAPPRSGKCVVGSTLVNTEDGIVACGELGFKEGYHPYVKDISTNEGIQKTSHSYLGSCITYKMTTITGRTIEATPEHSLQILTPELKLVWKPISQLKESDYVVMGKTDPVYPKTDKIGIEATIELAKYVSNLTYKILPNINFNIIGIPLKIRQSTKKVLDTFFQTYFATTKIGYKVKEYIKFSTVSRTLAKQLHTILWSHYGIQCESNYNVKYKVWVFKVYNVNAYRFCSTFYNPHTKLLKRLFTKTYQPFECTKYNHIPYVNKGCYSNLQEGLPIEIISNNYERVIKVKKERGNRRVFDFTVPETHSFIANGLLNHNTVMGTQIALDLGQKTLILAHQRDLIEQFCNETINDKKEMLFNGAKLKVSEAGICKKEADFHKYKLCLATYQTFISSKGQKLLDSISGLFGTVIIDEVHRAPADKYAMVMSRLKAKNCYGLTGTYDRKDGKIAISTLLVGPVLYKAKIDTLVPMVYGRNTADIGVKPRISYRVWNSAMQFLFKNTKRNESIAKQAVRDVKRGHIVLIPTTLNEHQQELRGLINSYAGEDICFLFNGKIPSNKRQFSRDQMNTDKRIKVIIATRSMLTGLNIPRISAIYTIAPISNNPTYEQEIKRVCTPMEGKRRPIIRFWFDGEMNMCHGCMRTCAKLLTQNKDYEIHSSFYDLLNSTKKDRNNQDDDFGIVKANYIQGRMKF